MSLPAPEQTPPIYLAGPTASGKSALAIQLAREIHGEIINADAFQLYRGMPICTAQPSAEDFAVAPHHLYAVLELNEICDAARYADLARPLIQEIQSRHKTPIVVGGSGLYLKALTHGLSDLPKDETLREQLAMWSPEQRVSRLLELDPDASHTVNLRNDRYVTRALEISILTGKPQSQLRQEWNTKQPEFSGLMLHWSRPQLNERIARRTQHMFENGLIDEIASLASLSTTAAHAIGIQEVQQYLRGELSLEETQTAIEIATRQYARRQEKWFRREKGFRVLELDPSFSPDQMLTLALQRLQN